MKARARAALIALPLASASGPASALICNISVVDEVAFGTYDPLSGAPVDASGTITFTCTDVGPYDAVSLHLSPGASADFSPRTLVSGAFTLAYNLFLDAARELIWGDGTGGTGVYGPTTPPEGAPVQVTIYARVPGGQNARVGTYSDSPMVTLHY